jgi:hypothetical protein
MKALIRYVMSDTLHTQRWVAPVLCFGAIDAIVSAQTGSVLPSFAISAAALLFIATWLTIVIVNNEDPVQLSITEVCAGSQSKVRLAKLLVAFVLSTALGISGMIGPLLSSSSRASITDLLAGLCAQAIMALAGVAIGALCSQPLIRRRAWSVLLGVLIGMGTVLIPHAPPTRQLLVLFNETGRFSLGPPVLVIGAETLVIAVFAVGASLKIAQRRS